MSVSLPQVLSLPQVYRFAVHTFNDIETAPFDAEEYSKLKFGSNQAARTFGYEMADAFLERYRDILYTEKCVVIPAPSTTVPVAATLLSHHFMNRLNSVLARDGKKPVEWTLIHRDMTYNNNYADLPKEERKRLLARDTIYINRDFVEGKFLIFVDDCTITGTHEEKISGFLTSEGLDNDHAFACLVKYEGDDPSIEGRLNHHVIKTADDLVDLAWEDEHSVTTRSLRLLLEYPEDKFEALLNRAPPEFIDQSYHRAIVKGYNAYPAYVENFNRLAQRFGMGRFFKVIE